MKIQIFGTIANELIRFNKLYDDEMKHFIKALKTKDNKSIEQLSVRLTYIDDKLFILENAKKDHENKMKI